MVQYIDKAAVVAEIEKKKIPFKKDIDDGVYPTYLCALMDFEDFINTLEAKEVKEEPVSKDLEEAAEEYAPDFSNSIASKAAVDAVRDAFKSGAEWLAGQGETLYDTINVDGKNQRWLGENLLYGDYNAGQAVIVQIRKV